MKTEVWRPWIIALVLAVLLGLAGMAAYNTVAGNREAALAQAWAERDQAMATAYWLRIKDMPLPYSPPLDELAISSVTGYRTDPMGGTTESLHRGIDLVGDIGTPVKAALSGRVVEHWPPPGTPIPGKPGQYYRGHDVYGGFIVLDHGDGLLSMYGHLHETFIHTGNYIEEGQVIGTIGSTGISTGPHLHWEVVVDPLRYFSERSGD